MQKFLKVWNTCPHFSRFPFPMLEGPLYHTWVVGDFGVVTYCRAGGELEKVMGMRM